jgi:hypothetical protein
MATSAEAAPCEGIADLNKRLSCLKQTMWHYDCRFPGQPRVRIVLRFSEGHTIRFGAEKAMPLEDGGSVGTGMVGHAYDVVRGGKLFAFAIPSDRKGYAARLNLWPTPAGAGQRGVEPRYLYGKCRVRVVAPRSN